MNALNSLLIVIVVIMIMSFGTGLILGGPEKATKILTWELKQLTKFGRWVLKHFFQTMSDLFRYLAKACGPQKKKTP